MKVDSWKTSLTAVHGRSKMHILSLMMLLCCAQDFPTCVSSSAALIAICMVK